MSGSKQELVRLIQTKKLEHSNLMDIYMRLEVASGREEIS